MANLNTWKYFKIEEFKCHCCGENNIDIELVTILDDIREILGLPMKVNSGYRCAKHNKEVGGKEDSAHLYGKAADTEMLHGRMVWDFVDLAKAKGIQRIGVYKTFVHVDIDRTKPQKVMWGR